MPDIDDEVNKLFRDVKRQLLKNAYKSTSVHDLCMIMAGYRHRFLDKFREGDPEVSGTIQDMISELATRSQADLVIGLIEVVKRLDGAAIAEELDRQAKPYLDKMKGKTEDESSELSDMDAPTKTLQ